MKPNCFVVCRHAAVHAGRKGKWELFLDIVGKGNIMNGERVCLLWLFGWMRIRKWLRPSKKVWSVPEGTVLAACSEQKRISASARNSVNRSQTQILRDTVIVCCIIRIEIFLKNEKKYVDKCCRPWYYSWAVGCEPLRNIIWASGGIGRLARFRF